MTYIPSMPTDRAPTPWRVVEREESFEVQDANGDMLGFFYFAVTPEPTTPRPRKTKDVARRLALNFAKLPDLLDKP